MDGIKLLEQARDAGLAVAVNGDKLVIRGPRRAEAVARLLMARKAEVMAVIAGADAQDDVVATHWREIYRDVLTMRALYDEETARRHAWASVAGRWHLKHGR